jgi:hypothetical protein
MDARIRGALIKIEFAVPGEQVRRVPEWNSIRCETHWAVKANATRAIVGIDLVHLVEHTRGAIHAR